jgi:hypothetical protein
MGEKQNTSDGTKISLKFSCLINHHVTKSFLINADVQVNLNIIMIFFTMLVQYKVVLHSNVTMYLETLDGDVLLSSSCLTNMIKYLFSIQTLRQHKFQYYFSPVSQKI